MPRITLPDGSERDYDEPVSAGQVASDIGPGLARAALGARVDGELRDLGYLIRDDAKLEIVAVQGPGKEPAPDVLFLTRHSCAHVMAEAIQRVFPGTLLVYGPPVETGFYYDLYVPDGKTISSEDFEGIEAEIRRIVEEDRPFSRYEMPVESGLEKLRAEGSKYKLDNAERAVGFAQ